MTRIGDLEKQLKETKQTFGKAILTLVDRIKTLEAALKRKTKRVILSDSEEEETKAQGRKTHDLDHLVSLVQELVTPSKTVNASGEEQVEDISPTTLEAAAILTKVQKIKSVDKGKRYKRRKSSKEFAGTGLDFEEVKSAFEEVNTGGIEVRSGIEEVNAGSLDVNTGIDSVTTDSIRVSVPSPDRGRREGKAPTTEEEETQASRKTKEQILQEEVGLTEVIRLDALEKALKKEEVAKQVHLDSLIAQRMAEEQELTEGQKKRKAQESVLGKDLTVEDYAKRMIEFGKFEGDWRRLHTKTAKKLKFDEKIARKGLHTDHDKDESEDSDEANEKDDSTSGTKIPINPVPVATKSPSIANYKIIKQGRKGVYQIVRENGTDMVYISFGAMLTDISRDDLTELYRIVMKKHGMNEPEDEFEKVLWEYLKNMFEEPLSTDSIWSLPGQQRIICWRYYDACRVHCLNLESADVYMLIERKYPLSAEVCKAMLDKKLQGGKPDEDCYKLLKMMEKQAGFDHSRDDELCLLLYHCVAITGPGCSPIAYGISKETEAEVSLKVSLFEMDLSGYEVPRVLVTCRRRQIDDENDDDENVPLYYHINKDFSIPFGREEFCLVTGLSDIANMILDQSFSQLYDDDVVSLCSPGILQLVILGVESIRVVPDWMLRLANDRVAWDKYLWGSYV
ncbi:hypothetical protein Tco_0559002, partial [Tanacetum coccineum]